MIKKLFNSFIFLAPFTSFFALSAWLRLPVVISQLLFIITIIGLLSYKKFNTKWVLTEDLYLLSFLVLVWVSFALGYKEKRSFNHSLAYTYAVCFYFFLNKYVIKHLSITSYNISKVIYLSFIFSSIIILIDFIGINFFDFSFRNIYSVLDHKTSNMDYYIRGGLKRVGGVAEEPGTMALFYNIYFGITLYFLSYKNTKKIYFCIALFFLCHFALFSTAGMALAFIISILVFVFEKISINKITIKQVNYIFLIGSLLLITISIAFILDVGNIRLYFSEILNKILFNESGYSSSGQRVYQWKRALTNFWKHPVFGSGPGYGVQEDKEGYLSVYFTILSDTGLVAFIFFSSFIVVIFRRALKITSKKRPFILFSLLTSLLHLFIVSDFYHAPFWILLLLIQLIYLEKKEETS